MIEDYTMILDQNSLEKINEINKVVRSNLTIIGFIDGQYKSLKSKAIVTCQIHGKGCDFANPWNPIVETLKNGFNCPKCAGKYSPTTEEAILEINQKIDKNLKAIGFVGGSYKTQKTNTIIECKVHGRGCDFANPWNPTFDKLKMGFGCPKCAGQYSPTTEEALKEINQLISPDLNVIGFVGGKYKSQKTKTIIECKIHGRGCHFEKPWNPVFYSLKVYNGCPICSVEKQAINDLLKNPVHCNSKRNIYFITFKNLKNNQIFYKIGITNEKGYKKRFNKLNKDNVEILDAQEIQTTNLIALLTEYYVLTQFKEYKKYMFHVLKHNHGGSECFSYDLTKILTLEEMIETAKDNFENIIKNFDLKNINLNLLKLYL